MFVLTAVTAQHMRYALLSDWLVDGLRFVAPEGGAAGASSAA